MKFIIQQVAEASVYMPEKDQKQEIKKGVLVYVGIHKNDKIDAEKKIKRFTQKIQTVKLLSGKDGKINNSLTDIQGELLLIPNFTLYGRNKKGSSIDYTHSAKYQVAELIFKSLIEHLLDQGIKVKTGIFGAKMIVKSSVLGPINCIREF